MQHANKADAALNASIDIAQRYELVPRKQLGAWVFFDERMKPISVSEDEPSASPFRRGGKWVRLEE